MFAAYLKDQVLGEIQTLVDFPNAETFLPQTLEVNFLLLRFNQNLKVGFYCYDVCVWVMGFELVKVFKRDILEGRQTCCQLLQVHL